MTLVEFLTARLDEDELAAREAATDSGGTEWYLDIEDGVNAEGGGFVATGPWSSGLGPPGQHMVRHDPARVLRDVEAKRRIIEAHHRSGLTCPRCSLGAEDGQVVFERDPCETLRLIALPYADHPDYDPEWHPA